ESVAVTEATPFDVVGFNGSNGGPITHVITGQAFTDSVAFLQEGMVPMRATDYSQVTVYWGDGSSSTPSLEEYIPNGLGNLLVVGTHTYAQAGTYTTSFTASETDTGRSATITTGTIIAGTTRSGYGY